LRENWARLIVLISGIMVVLLSMLFARIQNPERYTQGKSSVVETKQVTQGEQLFQQQGCARCHSIKGEGGLAGVINKYTDKELLDWMTGAEILEGQMTRSMMKVKSKYQKLTEEELDALVEYLRSQ